MAGISGCTLCLRKTASSTVSHTLIFQPQYQHRPQAAELRLTSPHCGCLPLAAGLCAVTTAAAVDTFSFVGLISHFVLHKLDTLIDLMNVGADTRPDHCVSPLPRQI